MANSMYDVSAKGGRLKDLKEMCETLGLNPTPTRGRINKETGERYLDFSRNDYIKAIRECFIGIRRADGNLSPFLAERLEIEDPMLALQIKNLDEKEQQEVWRDGSKWIFEQKIDGCRITFHWNRDWGYELYSRNDSVNDMLPIAYGDNLLIFNPDFMPSLERANIHDFIIDCELVPINKEVNKDVEGYNVITDTQQNLTTSILSLNMEQSLEVQEKNPMKLVVFDIIRIDGNWLTDKTLRERKELLSEVYENILKPAFKEQIELVPNSGDTPKQDYYNQIIANGDEGVVAKDLDSKYDLKGKRAGEWIKIKRSVSQSLLNESFGDFIDAFIIGYNLGTPGTNNEKRVASLNFGIYLTDDEGNLKLDENQNPVVHHIATVGGLKDELKDALTVPEKVDAEGNVIEKAHLDAKFMGYVAEIDGQDVSSKELRLMHPILVSWRPDKSADKCKIKESFLKSLIL